MMHTGHDNCHENVQTTKVFKTIIITVEICTEVTEINVANDECNISCKYDFVCKCSSICGYGQHVVKPIEMK